MKKYQDYKAKRMKQSPEFWNGYGKRFEVFKLGILLKQARLVAGLTQEQIADKLSLSKSLISRMENDAPDVRLTHLERFAETLGKKLYVVLD